MDEFTQHVLVFLPLFVFIRWKFEWWTSLAFICLPFLGEFVQLLPIFQNWGFMFEWHDMAANYFASGTGWALMAAIQEHRHIRFTKRMIKYE